MSQLPVSLDQHGVTKSEGSCSAFSLLMGAWEPQRVHRGVDGRGPLLSSQPSQHSSVSWVLNGLLICSLYIMTKSSHGHDFLSEDVEDELVREEIILSPVSSMRKLQVVSKPIDLSVAKVGVNCKV